MIDNCRIGIPLCTYFFDTYLYLLYVFECIHNLYLLYVECW